MSIHPPRVIVATRRDEVRRRTCAALANLGCAVIGEPGPVDLGTIVGIFTPDVVVLDLDGPPWPTGPVIWLPGAGSTGDQVADAWRAGATDVVPDPADVDDVVRRVWTAVGGCDRDGPGLADLTIDVAGHVARRAGSELKLTATEFRLLVAFATNVGIVVSKPQLLRAVWGFDDYHVNLVEVHVSALRRELERHGERLIHTVRGVGYVMRRPSARGDQPETGPDRPWTSPAQRDEIPA